MRKTIKTILTFTTAILLLLGGGLAWAAAVSPLGKWTTIDDKTGKARSIIQISEMKDVLYGKIVKVYKQAGDTGYCTQCPGDFKNKPVEGLTILWGLKQTGPDKWEGGSILDPKSGNIYRCYIELAPDGKSLKIRGYIGISLLGRTQTWLRSA